MKVTLKTWNYPKLVLVWILNVAVFSGVVSGVLNIRDFESIGTLFSVIETDPWGRWPYICLLTLVSVFNGAFPRWFKEALVFWPALRPGSRAFSHFMHKDSTINRKVLQAHFAPFPTDPGEQNALWVGWLGEFSNDPRVRSSYGPYLFARDWMVIATATLVVAGPLSLWLAADLGRALAYGAVLLCQCAVARWVARVQGEQLVKTVMSCKGSSLASHSVENHNLSA